MKIRGPLNVEILQAAFTFLVERHPTLRMVVSSDAGELWQDMAKVQAPDIEILEAQGWDEKAIKAHAVASARQRFHLNSGPLLRLKIYLRAEGNALALLVAHHIVLDMWSLAQLAAELAIVYGALKRGERPALPSLQYQYEDFVRWQERLLTSNKGKELSTYWLSRMKDAPSGLALPLSQQGSLQTANCIHHFQIGAKLSAQLMALSRKQQVTPHALLLAAFEVLLHRHTGQMDFLLGLLSSGRNQQCTENVIGYFVNLVVLRPNFSRNLSFAAYLQQSFREMLSAIDHSDLPFSVLTEQLYANRQASRGQLVQATCILQPAPSGTAKGLIPFIMGRNGGKFAVDDLLFKSTEFIEEGAQFDLTLVACNDDEKITAAFKYDPSRFDPEFIARLAERYDELLHSIAEDSSVPVGRVVILTKKELLQITGWNNTACKVRNDVCIHTLIEEQIDQTPDRPAIAFEDTSLTYRELDVETNRLAHYLTRSGLTPESKVGVYLERSLSMVVAMLAIFKAGGAYVPLDPSHPAERIDSILKSSGVLLIITNGYLATRIKPPAEVRTISLDREGEHISKCNPDRISRQVNPESLAYVMYTSGSTGTPKGVMIEHRRVVNFFCGMDRKVGCGPEDTLLAVTSISFDISVLELLWPLTCGAQVIIVHDQALQPSAARRVRQQAKQVQFSLFYFASADAEGAQSQYQMLMEGAKLADQFGLAAVWTPERHFHAFGGLYPNPSLTNAALAMITSRIHLRAGSVVLPLHNPIRVAEEWALVDQLSKGRVGIAFASGWHADDFVLAPQNYPERKEVMYRSIETVQQLWRGDSIKVPGGAGNEVEIKLHPRPIQPALPIWITSAGSADTFESAARIGANVLTHLLGQEMRDVEKKIGVYRKELARQGQDPSSGTVTLMLHTYLDSNFDQVRRKALQPFKRYLRSSVGLVSKLVSTLNLDLDLNNMNEGDLDDLLTFAAERYMSGSGLFGTPETCSAMIESVRDIGADEIACLVDFGVDLASTMQSIRYIEELHHRFNSTSKSGDYALHSQALRNGVTLLQCTPSLMRMLLHSEGTQQMLGSLRILLLGGEALPQPLVQAVRTSYKGPILNMYGPTETTIWSAVESLENEENAVFIGGPIVNTQIYILNPDLQHCPTQVTGELCIGGDGLARGYLGDPSLTAQRFLPDPFSSVPGSRIYCTGDLGRFQKDGRIALAGRSDQQVKLRGYRIELGDVDAALNRAPGVRTGITVKSLAEEDELVGYLIPANDEIDLMEVRKFLRNQLPSYMIPGKLLIVRELPLTPNGKIDRASLLKVHVPHKPAPAPNSLSLADPLADTVLNIWKEVLKSEQISLDDNFFDIGGHSLLIVQVHERLQRALHRTFPLATLLRHPTIRSITAFLEGAGEFCTPLNSELETTNRQRNALLSQRNRNLAVRVQH
jgi:natural product biosynthesis luciferase-like monooxygenase protein